MLGTSKVFKNHRQVYHGGCISRQPERTLLDSKIIQIGDEGQLATRELARRFEALAGRHPGLDSPALRTQLRTLESIDRQYGSTGVLPLEDVEELLAATLTELAHVDEHARRLRLAADEEAIADLTLGVALWATRHEVPIPVAEPV